MPIAFGIVFFLVGFSHWAEETKIGNFFKKILYKILFRYEFVADFIWDFYIPWVIFVFVWGALTLLPIWAIGFIFGLN